MAIVVPGVAKNYPSPLVAIASPFGTEPQEGQYQIPIEIDWGTMGGPNNLVSFNASLSGDTVAVSQICAAKIDNSSCGSDIQFIFTDTSETITIPAYCPYALVPVFSRSLQWFVAAGINGEVVLSNDVTRITMFNYAPPPIAVGTTQEQNIASVTNINGTVVASTAIIPSTVSGTLEQVFITANFQHLDNGNCVWKLVDGTGKTLAVGNNQEFSNSNPIVLQITDAALRFSGGVFFNITSTSLATTATYAANLYYRTP